jgi:hypothetical protein
MLVKSIFGVWARFSTEFNQWKVAKCSEYTCAYNGGEQKEEKRRFAKLIND